MNLIESIANDPETYVVMLQSELRDVQFLSPTPRSCTHGRRTLIGLIPSFGDTYCVSGFPPTTSSALMTRWAAASEEGPVIAARRPDTQGYQQLQASNGIRGVTEMFVSPAPIFRLSEPTRARLSLSLSGGVAVVPPPVPCVFFSSRRRPWSPSPHNPGRPASDIARDIGLEARSSSGRPMRRNALRRS